MRSPSDLEDWERAVMYSRVLFVAAIACLVASRYLLEGRLGLLAAAVAAGALAMAFHHGYRGKQSYQRLEASDTESGGGA